MAVAETKYELLGHVALNDNSVIVVGSTESGFVVVRYMRIGIDVKAAHIPAAKFDDLVRRKILPRGYHTSWTRATVQSDNLQHCIRALGSHPYPNYDAEEVYFYITCTNWGENL